MYIVVRSKKYSISNCNFPVVGSKRVVICNNGDFWWPWSAHGFRSCKKTSRTFFCSPVFFFSSLSLSPVKMQVLYGLPFYSRRSQKRPLSEEDLHTVAHVKKKCISPYTLQSESPILRHSQAQAQGSSVC